MSLLTLSRQLDKWKKPWAGDTPFSKSGKILTSPKCGIRHKLTRMCSPVFLCWTMLHLIPSGPLACGQAMWLTCLIAAARDTAFADGDVSHDNVNETCISLLSVSCLMLCDTWLPHYVFSSQGKHTSRCIRQLWSVFMTGLRYRCNVSPPQKCLYLQAYCRLISVRGQFNDPYA